MRKLSKNSKLVFSLVLFVGLMIGVAYASVPLYTLFCRATGFGGTPQRVADSAPVQAPAQAKDRVITVFFDGNVDPALPWDFVPEVRSVQVRLGEEKVVKYRATNRGTAANVGTATFNVQPDRAGAYFDKIQCFCFTKQALKPGQTEEMAVEFYIDPAMAQDRANDDVQNITLSYTFFLAKDQSKARALKQADRTNPAANPQVSP